MYERLFARLVGLTNAALAASAAAATANSSTQAREGRGGSGAGGGNWIGLLDIFGMEHFEVNRFDQLLINFANERLQSLFIEEAVTRVQAEFKYEGVEFDSTVFRNNADVVELLNGKVSVLSLLSSQSVSNSQPDDGRFVQELHNHFGGGKHPAYATPLKTAGTQFTIKHFAADVTYTVADLPGGEGFVSRNKDALLPKLPQLLRGSQSSFLAGLFPANEAAKNGAGRPPVAHQFRQSMSSLSATLEGSMQHFVRCIKPNSQHAPFLFEPPMVRDQLLNCSVRAAADVSRAGYPYRASFFDMLDQFDEMMTAGERRLMLQGSDIARMELVRKLMANAGFDAGSYTIGRSKVFGTAGLEARLSERIADLAASRAEEAELRRQKWENMDASQRARMAELEAAASAAAEAAIAAERERTEVAQARAVQARERAAEAEAEAAKERAAMTVRLAEEKAAMEEVQARAMEEAAERESARAAELERKRLVHAEEQRLWEEKAAAAEAKAREAAASAAAAGEEMDKQVRIRSQIAGD